MGSKCKYTRWGIRVAVFAAALLGRALGAVAGGGPASAARPDYHFDGSISRTVLEHYLDRSISMEGLLNGAGVWEETCAAAYFAL